MALARTGFDVLRSPDLAPFVVHFVGRAGGVSSAVPPYVRDATPKSRLRRILSSGRLEAYPVFGSKLPVCASLSARLRAPRRSCRKDGSRRGHSPFPNSLCIASQAALCSTSATTSGPSTGRSQIRCVRGWSDTPPSGQGAGRADIRIGLMSVSGVASKTSGLDGRTSCLPWCQPMPSCHPVSPASHSCASISEQVDSWTRANGGHGSSTRPSNDSRTRPALVVHDRDRPLLTGARGSTALTQRAWLGILGISDPLVQLGILRPRGAFADPAPGSVQTRCDA